MISRFAEHIGEITAFAIAAMIFGVIRLLLLPGDSPLRVYFVSLAVSIPVGTIIGALAMEWGCGDYASMAAASIGSLLAHDLLTGLMSNRAFLGALLKRAAENITDRMTK